MFVRVRLQIANCIKFDLTSFHLKDIKILGNGDEERPYLTSARQQIEEYVGVILLPPGNRETKDSGLCQSILRLFLLIQHRDASTCRSFTFQYGKEDDYKIELRILSETEQITVCLMEGKDNEAVFQEAIPWNSDPRKWNTMLCCLIGYSHLSKAKQNYLMSSYTVTTRT